MAVSLDVPWLLAILSFLVVVPALVTVALDLDLIFPEHLLFSILPLLTLTFYFSASSFAVINLGNNSPLVIMVLAAVFVLLYIQFLTLNIINIATVRTIPLKRVAISIYFFIGLVLYFTGLFFLLPTQLVLTTKAVLFFLLTYLMLQAQSYANQEVFSVGSFGREVLGRPKLVIFWNILLASLILEIFLPISFLKSGVLIKSLTLTIFAFSLLSIFEHYRQKTLTKSLLREHLLIMGAFLTILLAAAAG